MVAIVDRCHSCGTKRRSMEERFCHKCGAGLPEAPPEMARPPADGIAWSRAVPIINNRYLWIRWGWAALYFGAGFAVLLGTPLVVLYAEGNGGAGFAIKLFLVLGLVAAAVVIGAALFAAVSVGNRLMMAFVLSPVSAAARTSGKELEGVESAALLFAPGSRDARNSAQAAALLLPPEGEAKWKDVRRVQFDAPRCVITLRRRWRHPLRLYVVPGRWTEAEAFVREHASPAAVAGKRT